MTTNLFIRNNPSADTSPARLAWMISEYSRIVRVEVAERTKSNPAAAAKMEEYIKMHEAFLKENPAEILVFRGSESLTFLSNWTKTHIAR